jgi:hypothetical protein
MARRRHARLRGLSAITGERLEFFLPSKLADEVFGDVRIRAMCAPDVEGTIRGMTTAANYHYTKWEMRQEEKLRSMGLPVRPIPAEVLKKYRKDSTRRAAETLVEQMVSERNQLRKRGVTGPIPVCLYRNDLPRTSTYGSREGRRLLAAHERFHADARRIEQKIGVDYEGCEDSLTEMLDMRTDPDRLPIWQWSARFFSPNSPTATEELLARVASIQDACGKNLPRCAEVESYINNDDFFGLPNLSEQFRKFHRDVKEKYGTPQNAMRAACRIAASKLKKTPQED